MKVYPFQASGDTGIGLGHGLQRRGFTLIEMLVVVAVIGLLAAVLIPAVQSAREAARRIQCTNNLHQLGIAVAAYESTHRVFPKNVLFSSFVMVLPFMDQTPLFNSINFTSSPFFAVTPENSTASNTGLAVLSCPSDASGTVVRRTNSYAGNSGVGYNSYGSKRNGPMAFSTGRGRGYGSQNVADGTSHTASMAEWCRFVPFHGRDPRRAVFRTSRPLLKERQMAQFVEACRAIDVNAAEIVMDGKGPRWLEAAYGYDTYNHIVVINGNSCYNYYNGEQGAFTAGSMHSGGANTLFLDGRVQFIKDSISPPTWWALGSMNGNEVVSSDSL